MISQGAGCLGVGVGWDDDIGGQVNLCEYRFSLGTLPRFLYLMTTYFSVNISGFCEVEWVASWPAL